MNGIENPGTVHTTRNNGLMTQVQQIQWRKRAFSEKWVLKELYIHKHTQKMNLDLNLTPYVKVN